MSENNNQNDQSKKEDESSDETQPKYRDISEEELKQILEEHEKWVSSGEKEGRKANLAEVNLQNSNLEGVNLQKANLNRADLQEAFLNEANLKQANLNGTNLQSASLFKANLQEAKLYSANLQNANLPEANMHGALLRQANLYVADFMKANMEKADLRESNMRGANLKQSNLKEADLEETELHDANLSKANLQKANLNRARLQDAILVEASLQWVSLGGADLQRAVLWQADLQDANLYEAELQGAKLDSINLKNANFYNSKMQNTVLNAVKGLSTANLQYANLEGATGLLGNEFAQADVTGTKLPDDIKKFTALETVEKTSQNARKIFFAMLLGCVYSWLTIATTTDVRLLTNTASSPLPIIGTEIPIAWFYIAAPLVLICLYFYFHLYLDNLWGALASLPAIFPDGKRLDERAYPWLLNTLVRRHFKRLKNRPLIARMKEWITIFLAWWVVPFTMIAFWLRYIVRHDWWGTSFHIGLIILSLAFANYFYRLCALTLQGKKKISLNLRNFWQYKAFYYYSFKYLLFSIFVLLIGLLFSLISIGAINGIRTDKQYITVSDDFHAIKVAVPLVFKVIGYNVFADFREKDVSELPANYWELNESIQLKSVKGANLKGRNLNNADMSGAFLVKADFRNAMLISSECVLSNLHEANFYKANLYKAKLMYAKLQQANLQKAILIRARLNYANLKQAKLSETKLSFAELAYANLQQAQLYDADLVGANLNSANIQKADFSGADLTGAKYLKIDQLSKVKTLYKTKLDPELLEQVKKCCPHLLEEPKEETDDTK